MIYLQHEEVEFTKTKEEFEEMYLALLEEMYKTFTEKGKTRDAQTPIHHRMSPVTMLALAQAKMRRIETLLSKEDWDEDKIIEECGDVANYNLYIAALCKMLQKEAKK